MRFRLGKLYGAAGVPAEQTSVRPGVYDVRAGAQDRDGVSADLESPDVRGAVDAEGQPTDHHRARPSELPSQPLGNVAAARRGPARPDDRDRGAVEQGDSTSEEEHRRWIGQMPQR
jgi:hypothetical protein